MTADSASVALVTARDCVATSFEGRRTRALVAATGNRMFDFAALVAALTALDAHARPSQVMMVYAVAQALALIPLTPGGLGFVESGMTTLLVLIGVTADQAVLGTLLYRLIAFWLPIPLGALAWAGLEDQPAPVPARGLTGHPVLRSPRRRPCGGASSARRRLDLGAVGLLLQRRVLLDALGLGVLAVQGLAHLGLHVGEVVGLVAWLSAVMAPPCHPPGRRVERVAGYWSGCPPPYGSAPPRAAAAAAAPGPGRSRAAAAVSRAASVTGTATTAVP